MKLFLASANAHKAREFQALAYASGLRVSVAPAAEMPAVTEDAGTFSGNARKKAKALRARLPAESWVVADDSGLCVDALGGAPGVESAYFAGRPSDSAANLAKLIRELRGAPVEKRGAHFVCVLVLIGPDVEQVFEGRCDGRLLEEARGSAGFGYDPIFVPAGCGQSFAELGGEIKNRISHRARAWAKLEEWLNQR
ncbi:MAG: RdgB/HAM1 family non-canonical purine NTP pyrophosphatase [Verrucomicrobiota bacterium]|nr:RdgB/HAM1 family non-canonical purine NTP pyrophosphatase [Verrucomicrobiota bacterium]